MKPVIKHGQAIPISREMALDMGLIEPTPDERAEMDRKAAEWRQRAAGRAAVLAAARHRLAQITDPLARRILDLHTEDACGECDGCDPGMYAESSAGWPCSTIDAIADHYGIPLGGDR